MSKLYPINKIPHHNGTVRRYDDGFIRLVSGKYKPYKSKGGGRGSSGELAAASTLSGLPIFVAWLASAKPIIDANKSTIRYR